MNKIIERKVRCLYEMKTTSKASYIMRQMRDDELKQVLKELKNISQKEFRTLNSYTDDFYNTDLSKSTLIAFRLNFMHNMKTLSLIVEIENILLEREYCKKDVECLKEWFK